MKVYVCIPWISNITERRDRYSELFMKFDRGYYHKNEKIVYYPDSNMDRIHERERKKYQHADIKERIRHTLIQPLSELLFCDLILMSNDFLDDNDAMAIEQIARIYDLPIVYEFNLDNEERERKKYEEEQQFDQTMIAAVDHPEETDKFLEAKESMMEFCKRMEKEMKDAIPVNNSVLIPKDTLDEIIKQATANFEEE